MAASKKGTEKPKSIRPSGSSDTNFFELVHEVARQIPKGRVTSYGAIAACLGTKIFRPYGRLGHERCPQSKTQSARPSRG